MIKIQNNTPTREALPPFLVGLQPESLRDLTWTDPALGVQNLAWWPEQDDSPALGPWQAYGAETLTLGDGVVHVVRAVVDVPQPVPQVLTRRQARRVLLAAGLLDDVEAAVAAADRETQIDWADATEMRRDWPALQAMADALGMTDAQLDALFVQGAAL